MSQAFPKMWKVKTSEGHIYDVPDENIDEALARDPNNEILEEEAFNANALDGGSLSESSKNLFFKDHTGIFEVPISKSEEAKRRGAVQIDEKDIPPIPQEEEADTLGKFGARSAKTIASEVVGSLPDTLSSVYNIPAMAQNAQSISQRENGQSQFAPESFVPEAQAYPDQQLPLIPSVAHAVDSSIDKATGDYTKTKDGDVFQSALRTATAVATPGGLSKLGKNAITKGLGALGTTAPIGVASAAAAGGASQVAANEGYGALASVGAGMGAGALTGGAAIALKEINKRLALATLTGNSPKNINLDAVKAAEESGVDYMNTLVNESKALALADQLVSKTPYFGSKQAKKMDVIDKSYAQSIDNAINDVGKKIVESDSALDTGSMIKDVFSNVKQDIINQKDELYQVSNSLLPEGATWQPTNIVKTINDIRNKTKTLVASPDQTSVLSYLDKLENGIVLGGDSAKVITPVPVEMLVGTKISINDIINWDINASGAKKQLRMVQHAIKEDLKAYGQKNPKWYESFIKADEFYGKKLGDNALGSEAVKNIFKQQDPEKILPSLNKVSDFKAIEQSLGGEASGQQFFDSIKREKLSDLLMGKVVNATSDKTSYVGFSKVLESPANKELVKYLAGEKYKVLESLNQYAKAALRRTQRIPNPSGTAPTNVIYAALGSAVTTGVGAGISGGLMAGITAGALPIGGAALLGKALSWFVSNKKFLKMGIEEAKNISEGNLKSANTYSQRIMRNMQQDLGDDFVRQFAALSKQEIE